MHREKAWNRTYYQLMLLVNYWVQVDNKTCVRNEQSKHGILSDYLYLIDTLKSLLILFFLLAVKRVGGSRW